MASKNKVSMNNELLRWMNESKDNVKIFKNKKVNTNRDLGTCQICGNNKAEAVCLKCNKSVCKSCYFKIIGICKKCVPTDIAKKWDGSSLDLKKKLGIEWIE